MPDNRQRRPKVYRRIWVAATAFAVKICIAFISSTGACALLNSDSRVAKGRKTPEIPVLLTIPPAFGARTCQKVRQQSYPQAFVFIFSGFLAKSLNPNGSLNALVFPVVAAFGFTTALP